MTGRAGDGGASAPGALSGRQGVWDAGAGSEAERLEEVRRVSIEWEKLMARRRGDVCQKGEVLAHNFRGAVGLKMNLSAERGVVNLGD